MESERKIMEDMKALYEELAGYSTQRRELLSEIAELDAQLEEFEPEFQELKKKIEDHNASVEAVREKRKQLVERHNNIGAEAQERAIRSALELFDRMLNG